jgi:hypothetical protein
VFLYLLLCSGQQNKEIVCEQLVICILFSLKKVVIFKGISETNFCCLEDFSIVFTAFNFY